MECTFLEIHNETITDLLDPSVTNMQIREGQLSGAYVEGLKTVKVGSGAAVIISYILSIHPMSLVISTVSIQTGEIICWIFFIASFPVY